MRIEFTRRAVADLHKVSIDCLAFGDDLAAKVEARIRHVIARIAEHPRSGSRVAGRAGLHVVPLIRYPYKVFYRLSDDRVTIVHIRHTARRPWAS